MPFIGLKKRFEVSSFYNLQAINFTQFLGIKIWTHVCDTRCTRRPTETNPPAKPPAIAFLQHSYPRTHANVTIKTFSCLKNPPLPPQGSYVNACEGHSRTPVSRSRLGNGYRGCVVFARVGGLIAEWRRIVRIWRTIDIFSGLGILYIVVGINNSRVKKIVNQSKKKKAEDQRQVYRNNLFYSIIESARQGINKCANPVLNEIVST